MTDAKKLREAISFYRCGHFLTNGQNEHLAVILDAAESTLPKTKMVEVWHVEWMHQPPNFPCEYHVTVHKTEAAARDDAKRMREHPTNHGQWVCIRVTGPHEHEVPA